MLFWSNNENSINNNTTTNINDTTTNNNITSKKKNGNNKISNDERCILNERLQWYGEGYGQGHIPADISEPKWCSFLCQTVGKESNKDKVVGGKGNNCYYFSIDGIKVWLEPTMVIHPNRFAVEAEYENSTSTPKKMVSFTLSEGNGNHLTITLPDARTFLNWHTAVRVALADLIFSQALCSTKPPNAQGHFGQGQGICISVLEQAIMLCGSLVPEDHPTMMRAKTLWISKLELQDVVDRLKDCPQKVRKEEVRVLVQQLADENADPLLVSDPDAIFVLKIGAKVLTKSELMAFCKPASPAFKTMSAFEHDYNDENSINGSRRGLSKQKSGKMFSSQKSYSSKLSPALTPNATSALMTISNQSTGSTTPRVPLKNLLSTFKTPHLSPISSLSLMSTKNNKSTAATADGDFKEMDRGGLVASPAEIKVNPSFKSKSSKNIPEGYVTNTENIGESNDENDILPKASIASRSGSGEDDEGLTSLPVAEVMNEKQASSDLDDELHRVQSSSSSSSSGAPRSQLSTAQTSVMVTPINGVPLWILVSIIIGTILVTVMGSTLMIFGIQSLTKNTQSMQHPYYAGYNDHRHPSPYSQPFNPQPFVYDHVIYEQAVHPNQRHSINRNIQTPNHFNTKAQPFNHNDEYVIHSYTDISHNGNSLRVFHLIFHNIRNAFKNILKIFTFGLLK